MTDTADPIGRAVADALVRVLPGVVDQLAGTLGPRAYSVAEVADRLGVSKQTVYNLIRAGRLDTIPHLPMTRVAARALDAFLTGRAS
jgi:hypothetical protein